MKGGITLTVDELVEQRAAEYRRGVIEGYEAGFREAKRIETLRRHGRALGPPRPRGRARGPVLSNKEFLDALTALRIAAE
jgi:hypothetical protein